MSFQESENQYNLYILLGSELSHDERAVKQVMQLIERIKVEQVLQQEWQSVQKEWEATNVYVERSIPEEWQSHVPEQCNYRRIPPC